jgi:uncharacterized protein
MDKEVIESNIIRILVDGDGCPVLKIIEEVARQYNFELIIFTNYAHQLKIEYGQVVKVDIEDQAVDIEIINRVKNGDIVITQDYGLAALVVLNKGVFALNNSGLRYTEKNIDSLLIKRHFYARARRAGKKHPTQSKRTVEDNEKFKEGLIKLIEEINIYL